MIETFFVVQVMKKKLLHIVLYLVYGGLEKIVYDFSRELNGKDYEVHVAALERGGPIGDQLHQEGIPVHILGKRPGKFDFGLLLKLTKLIKKLQIQVIHSHTACIMYAALAGKLAGVSTIIHTDHGRYLPDRKVKIWEDRIFSRLVSCYVCVSRDLETYMLSSIKVPSKKLITILNGVDTSHYYKHEKENYLKLRGKYNIPHNAIVIGTICRLIPPKNISFLIEWVQNNKNLHQNIVLVVVGDGPQYSELVKKAHDIPENKIKFMGARENIADLLNIFDIFTLVSTTEGTSLTILEAMATQLPVIVSDVGGNKDLITPGETGYLFESNNQKSFDYYVKKVINNPIKAGKLGYFARQSVIKNFNLKNVIRKYCELYDENEKTSY